VLSSIVNKHLGVCTLRHHRHLTPSTTTSAVDTLLNIITQHTEPPTPYLSLLLPQLLITLYHSSLPLPPQGTLTTVSIAMHLLQPNTIGCSATPRHHSAIASLHLLSLPLPPSPGTLYLRSYSSLHIYIYLLEFIHFYLIL
jgi:hypothetical protein